MARVILHQLLLLNNICLLFPHTQQIILYEILYKITKKMLKQRGVENPKRCFKGWTGSNSLRTIGTTRWFSRVNLIVTEQHSDLRSGCAGYVRT